MKFDDEFLEGKADASVQEPDKPAIKPAGENPVVGLTYDKTRFVLENNELADKEYQKHAVVYVTRLGWGVAPTLATALVSRANGSKMLSIREADIICRGKIDINHEIVSDILLDKWMGFITETDTVSSEDNRENIFALRVRWNKAVHWLKTRKQYDKIEVVNAGTAAMTEIVDKFKKLGYPLYPQELEEGFDEELLRPEFFSRDQWKKESQKYV